MKFCFPSSRQQEIEPSKQLTRSFRKSLCVGSPGSALHHGQCFFGPVFFEKESYCLLLGGVDTASIREILLSVEQVDVGAQDCSYFRNLSFGKFNRPSGNESTVQVIVLTPAIVKETCA